MVRRRWPILAAVMVATVVVWLLALVHFRHWIAHNDFAILRLNLEQELDGTIRTVGAFSRLGVYHPGPLREWAFVLPYLLSGSRASSLPATALVLNIGWAVWTGFLLARRPPVVRVTGLVGLVAVVIALGPDLASPWNPHLAILPMYLAAWGIVEVVATHGGRWVAPVCASSFAAQMHASALPTGGLALAGALVTVVWFGRAEPRRVVAPVVTALVLWSGPLVDLRHGRTSNMVRMLTVRDDGTSVGVGAAAGHASRLLWPPTMARHEAIASSAHLLDGFAIGYLALVVAVVLAGVVWTRGERRTAAVTALVAVVLVILTGALFVEPNYRYLYGPLQAAAVFVAAVAASIVMSFVLSIAMSIAMSRTAGSDRPGMTTDDRRRIARAMSVGAIAVISTCVVLVPADDHETPGRRALAIEAAVTAELDAHPEWRTVAVVDLGEQGASIDAELADIVYRSGRTVRSARFGLGFEPPTGADPVLAAAMGERLDCLATVEPPSRRLVSGLIPSNGLPVGVFVVDPGSVAAERCLR